MFVFTAFISVQNYIFSVKSGAVSAEEDGEGLRGGFGCASARVRVFNFNLHIGMGLEGRSVRCGKRCGTECGFGRFVRELGVQEAEELAGDEKNGNFAE